MKCFSLQTTDHIDNADQTDLAYPFHPHDALRVHLPFVMRAGELGSRRLEQVMMGLILAVAYALLPAHISAL